MIYSVKIQNDQGDWHNLEEFSTDKNGKIAGILGRLLAYNIPWRIEKDGELMGNSYACELIGAKEHNKFWLSHDNFISVTEIYRMQAHYQAKLLRKFANVKLD